MNSINRMRITTFTKRKLTFRLKALDSTEPSAGLSKTGLAFRLFENFFRLRFKAASAAKPAIRKKEIKPN